MSIFKSSNPMLKESMYEGSIFEGMSLSTENQMTIQGTLRKFGLLLFLTCVSAIFSWKYVEKTGNPLPIVLVGVFGSLILGFIIYRTPNIAHILSPIYALLEGLFVGAISVLYEYHAGAAGGYSGIVLQAVGLTLAVAASLYFLYRYRIIRVTQKLRSIIIMASVGLGVFYLLVFIGSLIFGSSVVPSFINSPSPIGIGFSILVVILASFRLLVDFDTVEQGAASGAPKHMEWFSAVGLLVTIVWLYIEILRLLAKLASRD
jgi:uncharacterized YccA/Bax inhibitor family protein